MRSGNPKLTALQMYDEAQAHKIVLDAVRETKGDMKKAAKKLGVDRRTLYRWFQARPKLFAKARALREVG